MSNPTKALSSYVTNTLHVDILTEAGAVANVTFTYYKSGAKRDTFIGFIQNAK